MPPTGYPHLFRFDLELVTLRAKELLSFALDSCSLVTSLPGIKRKTFFQIKARRASIRPFLRKPFTIGENSLQREG